MLSRLWAGLMKRRRGVSDVDEGLEEQDASEAGQMPYCPDCGQLMRKTRKLKPNGFWGIVWACACLETAGLPFYWEAGRSAWRYEPADRMDEDELTPEEWAELAAKLKRFLESRTPQEKAAAQAAREARRAELRRMAQDAGKAQAKEDLSRAIEVAIKTREIMLPRAESFEERVRRIKERAEQVEEQAAPRGVRCPDCGKHMTKARARRSDESWSAVWVCVCGGEANLWTSGTAEERQKES